MSTITMTKKGNVRLDGVKYKAVPAAGCDGCAFRNINCGGANCTQRGDKPEYKIQGPVIFVRKGEK